jgi:tRNA 2-thiouridine synthesizing protein A
MTTIIDGRELEPPEPLERTLEALDTLADGEDLLLLLYCQPHPLFNVLGKNGYTWSEEVRADGTREIRIRKQPHLTPAALDARQSFLRSGASDIGALPLFPGGALVWRACRPRLSWFGADALSSRWTPEAACADPSDRTRLHAPGHVRSPVSIHRRCRRRQRLAPETGGQGRATRAAGGNAAAGRRPVAGADRPCCPRRFPCCCWESVVSSSSWFWRCGAPRRPE